VAANLAIAHIHPALRELLLQRFAELGPLVAVVAAPLTEEVTVRLFLMSAIAWVVSRFTKNPSVMFATALLGSSLVFAVLHLGRPFPGDPAVAQYYRAALLTKYTLAGLPMGWLYWRWGLPYAMVCHAAVNATHLVFQRFVFGSRRTDGLVDEPRPHQHQPHQAEHIGIVDGVSIRSLS